MPSRTSELNRLKIAKKSTKIPATLKNNPDCNVLESLIEAKLIRPNTGSVPKENTNMIKAPLRKLPVLNE